MVIGVDLRCLPSDGSPGAGIAHASRALVNKLTSYDLAGISWILFLPQGAVPQAEENMWREGTHKLRIVRIENASGASLRRALLRYACDILFVPSGAIPAGLTIPVVPWVHDIAIFENPEWFPEPFLQRTFTTNLFRRGVMRARHVLAVSEFTRHELVKKFGISPESIAVTFEGGDSVLASLHGETLAAAKVIAKRKVSERGIRHPFILYMGTIEPRKNIPMLLSAWSDARPYFKRPADLVIAGRDGWKLGQIIKSVEAAKSGSSGADSILHRIETPSDEERRDLLLAAEIVAVPSLYEGFGLVALEGMQAQTAVVGSNATALPEVLGDAALQLPPENSAEWKETLVGLVRDELNRRKIARQGKERSQGMTWERSAQIVLNVLTEYQKPDILRWRPSFFRSRYKVVPARETSRKAA